MQNKANQTDQTAANNRGEDIRRDLPEEICSIWLGWRDSNPRMLVPETSALPLGDTPIVTKQVLLYRFSDVFSTALAVVRSPIRPQVPRVCSHERRASL